MSLYCIIVVMVSSDCWKVYAAKCKISEAVCLKQQLQGLSLQITFGLKQKRLQRL